MKGFLNMPTTIKTRIETYDVQPNSIIKMSALFKLFQKAAGDDFDKTGMTYEVLRSHGIVFVLTKNTVKFYDDIKKYDEVTITTYPRGTRGVSFLRDYDVFVGDKRVAYSSSTWVLLDINNRRLLRPNALDSIGSVPVSMDNFIEIEDKRIKFSAENLCKTDVREVYYSHIDYNGHMNNTHYPDIVFDYLPEEYKCSLKEKFISVYYVTELMQGQKYEVYTGCENGEYIVLAKNSETGKDIFTAVFDF